MPNLLSRYFWWTEERGTIHYDVMVSLILVFMFVAPHFIDFKDRPTETVALNTSEILVRADGQSHGYSRFKYQIRADMPGGPQPSQDEDTREDAILRVVEPISGAVIIERVEPVYDTSGKKIIAYNAWVVR